jgi:hypothetical protein
LQPPELGGNIAPMTTTTYDLAVRVIDHVDNEGKPCEHCQLTDATVQAQAYVTLGDPGYRHEDMIECCLACLIPALDSTPWLDTDRPIVVEVARSASRRPF